jgi:peptidoglycan hydrolase CwlO-like protein
MANMSGIQNEYTELTEAVNQYSTDISETTKDYTEQIEEIQESQNDANQLNNTTIGAVSQYIVDLQTIFNNITSYVQKK